MAAAVADTTPADDMSRPVPQSPPLPLDDLGDPSTPPIRRECGTYRAYQRHNKAGETPCAECRKAARDYMRRYRAERPELQEWEGRYNAARSRALTRLARLHPAQFEALLDEELGS